MCLTRNASPGDCAEANLGRISRSLAYKVQDWVGMRGQITEYALCVRRKYSRFQKVESTFVSAFARHDNNMSGGR